MNLGPPLSASPPNLRAGGSSPPHHDLAAPARISLRHSCPIPQVRGKLSRGQTLGKISREIAVHEAVQGTPGAVRLLGVFEDAQNVHMVQERCHGGDLRRLVEVGHQQKKC